MSIPRPETEHLVEETSNIMGQLIKRLLEIGVGRMLDYIVLKERINCSAFGIDHKCNKIVKSMHHQGSK